MFNNRCVSSVLFQLFFPHHSWRNPWSPSACSTTNINSARTLFLAAEVTRVCFFSSTLFPAHTFLILIVQTASYTHACWLTLITRGCGVLRSTRVLHTKLKRPGTRSNRLGPDPDPADHLNYRPEPVRVPGRVPGPRVSGPPWRPLSHTGSAAAAHLQVWACETVYKTEVERSAVIRSCVPSALLCNC